MALKELKQTWYKRILFWVAFVYTWKINTPYEVEQNWLYIWVIVCTGVNSNRSIHDINLCLHIYRYQRHASLVGIRNPPNKAGFKRNMNACKRADKYLFFTHGLISMDMKKSTIPYMFRTRLPPAWCRRDNSYFLVGKKTNDSSWTTQYK